MFRETLNTVPVYYAGRCNRVLLKVLLCRPICSLRLLGARPIYGGVEIKVVSTKCLVGARLEGSVLT